MFLFYKWLLMGIINGVLIKFSLINIVYEIVIMFINCLINRM